MQQPPNRSLSIGGVSKQNGFGNLVTMLQFGTLPHDLTKELELFSKEVMPKLRHLGNETGVAVARGCSLAEKIASTVIFS